MRFTKTGNYNKCYALARVCLHLHVGLACSAHTLGSYVPGDDEVAAASSDPYGDHAEPKNVTDHYR